MQLESELNGLGLTDKVVEIKRDYNQVLITNTFGGGYGGHEITFTLDSTLNIKDVNYHNWSDAIIEGEESTYSVDSTNLVLNQSPFSSDSIFGIYNLYLKLELKFSVENKRQGLKDTVSYFTFDGKFKNY